MDIDGVADELYGLPSAEFTAARDARSAACRRSGDRELAAAIKALRRPTAAAWLANRLVRDRPEDVGELLAVGEAMRRAQSDLSGDDLRRLAQDRQRLIAALRSEGRLLAERSGERVGKAALDDLEATFEAAVADEQAAAALRSGRLTAAIHHSGFGPLDLSGVVALPPSPAASARRSDERGAPRARRPGAGDAGPGARSRSARASRRVSTGHDRPAHDGPAVPAEGRRQVRERVRRAEAEVDAALGRAGACREEVDRARDLRAATRAAVAELDRRLADARQADEDAREALRTAEETMAAAERDARAAQRDLVRARSQAERLESG